MDKQHIADSSSRDREEHLPFPYMECTSHNHGYEFGKSVWCRHYIHISEAVYDKHTEYRRRQKFSEILHECRSWSFFIKNCKWQEAGEHCSCYAEPYSYYLLCNSHNLFLEIASIITIAAIVGIINESAPKHIRQTAETAILMSDEK